MSEVMTAPKTQAATPDYDNPETPYRSVWSHMMQVPFTQAYIDVNGLRTRYIQAGPKDAPAVVLIHGTGGHWEAFCANIGEYAKHFNTYAFDMVGAGFTDKPDEDYEVHNLAKFTRDFMLTVGLTKAHLVGISLGGWTAARFASNYPELTDKIVLISPVGAKRLTPAAGGANAEEEMAKRAMIVVDTTWAKTKSIFNGLIHEEKNVIPDLVKIRQTIHRLPNAERNMKHVLAMATPAAFERGALSDDELRGIKAPALIFVSEHDNPFFRKTAHVFGELIPGAKLIELANVAHWAQFETSDYFNETTVAFLRSA